MGTAIVNYNCKEIRLLNISSIKFQHRNYTTQNRI